MDEALFAKLAERVISTYTTYSKVEKGKRREVFLGLAKLPDEQILTYFDADFKEAGNGHYKIYSLEDFLQDPNTPKQISPVVNYLFNTLTNACNASTEKVSERTISTLTSICLHYIYRASGVKMNGADGKIVFMENDTENLKLFDHILKLYEPKYAEVIIAKIGEALDLPLDHQDTVGYTVRIRNYFLNLYNRQRILGTMNPDKLDKLLGSISDGDIGGSGVLGHLETCKYLDQPELHRAMNEVFFGNPG